MLGRVLNLLLLLRSISISMGKNEIISHYIGYRYDKPIYNGRLSIL